MIVQPPWEREEEGSAAWSPGGLTREGRTRMARHPSVAEADAGSRFGVHLVVGPETLPELLETGRLVEWLGFDGLFVFDHPAVAPDPWVCLSALPGVTERKPRK